MLFTLTEFSHLFNVRALVNLQYSCEFRNKRINYSKILHFYIFKYFKIIIILYFLNIDIYYC